MNKILVGLDLGTTFCKSIAYDMEGRKLSEASCPVMTDRSIENGAEQKPTDWILAIVDVMSKLTKSLAERAKNIVGMGVSSHGPGIVLTDAEGKVLLPCPIWQDNRSAQAGYTLFDRIGFDWVGLGVPQTALASRILWTAQSFPKEFENAKNIQDIKGFLLTFLTGNHVTEPSSGPCGSVWNSDMLEACCIELGKMDAVIRSDESAGILRSKIASITGFPEGVNVISGLNDGASAMLGAGVLSIYDGAVSVSTNGVARIIVPEKLPGKILMEQSMFCYPYVDDKWILGGFTKSAGDTVQWFCETAYVDLPPIKQLAAFNHDAEQSVAGARGIRFYPWLLGRGSPSATDIPQGVFTGLGRHHKRGDSARAILEGLSYVFRDIGETFYQMGFSWNNLRFTGGGMNSHLWSKILCHVLHEDYWGVQSDSLLGAVILAGVGIGRFSTVTEASKIFVKKNG